MTGDGVLFAQRELVKFGGLIHDGQTVERLVVDSADHVTVTTSTDSYHARTVIVAAGPWTSQLLEPLGLRLPLEVRILHPGFWKSTAVRRTKVASSASERANQRRYNVVT